MNNIEVFKNEAFGSIRTVMIENEPWFVGKDVAEILGYSEPRSAVSKKVDIEDRGVAELETPSGKQNMTIINESGLYSLILSSKLPTAKKFKRWVTSEVLPAIRKTGKYEAPKTIEEQIQLIALGTTQTLKRVETVETKIHQLETDMPLYGCEIDEIQKHVRKRGVDILGGKNSEAYRDGSIRGSVYSDIYCQLKREFGCVSSYKSIKRKYIDKAHEFIDGYCPPMALAETINSANMQMSFVC